MSGEETPFASRVAEGMRVQGLTLRRFCRAVELDPSFFSKVLSGKRSPPAEEAVLRRIAGVLRLDAADLIVSAGRIPSEWRALWNDSALFADINSLATGAALRTFSDRSRRGGAPAPLRVPVRTELAEELL